MTQELIERLRDRRGSIPIGCDKDGEVVFGDDHDALKAADALQSQSARIAELEGAREPKPWIDEQGTLRAPEGFHFTFVDAPDSFDTCGYPLKHAKLTPNISLSPRTQPVEAVMRHGKLFNRASNGDLVLASYTGRKSRCWIWSLSLSRELFGFHIVPKARRHGQWRHYLPMFGRTLIFARQDFHRDPRHQDSTSG